MMQCARPPGSLRPHVAASARPTGRSHQRLLLCCCALPGQFLSVPTHPLTQHCILVSLLLLCTPLMLPAGGRPTSLPATTLFPRGRTFSRLPAPNSSSSQHSCSFSSVTPATTASVPTASAAPASATTTTTSSFSPAATAAAASVCAAVPTACCSSSSSTTTATTTTAPAAAAASAAAATRTTTTAIPAAAAQP